DFAAIEGSRMGSDIVRSGLQELILGCLKHDPQFRIRSAEQVLKWLDRVEKERVYQRSSLAETQTMVIKPPSGQTGGPKGGLGPARLRRMMQRIAWGLAASLLVGVAVAN